MTNGWRTMVLRPLGALAAGVGLFCAIPEAVAQPVKTCAPLAHSVPAESIKSLARGFNLDGWMNGPGATPPDSAVLRSLRDAGMTHVRLPVPAERVMPQFATEADIREQLRTIDKALTELVSLGYTVSVDLHPGKQFSRLHRDNPSGSMKALEDAWSRLASIIERYPAAWIFAELLNEPDIDASRWQSEAERLARFIRQLLPRTTLIVGPVNWQRADSLPNFRPLHDLNVVYAIHFYDPMVFTHQGHWDATDPMSNVRGVPFPVKADDPAVQKLRQQLIADNKQRALEEIDNALAQARTGDVVSRQLAPAVAWQTQFGRPLIVNEFGVLKAHAPQDSRVRWLQSVVGFAERHCWGWAHWELAQGFGLVDANTGKPDADIMRALLGTR